jgi:hypothetical protein
MHGSGASRRGVAKPCLDLEQTPSFRGDAKHRTRNLEIPRCAIAHLRSGADAPSRNDGVRIALRGPSSCAHSRDPLARNDGLKRLN